MTDLKVEAGTIPNSSIKEELQKLLDNGDFPLAMVAIADGSVYVLVAGVARGQALAEAIMQAVISHEYMAVQ